MTSRATQELRAQFIKLQMHILSFWLSYWMINQIVISQADWSRKLHEKLPTPSYRLAERLHQLQEEYPLSMELSLGCNCQLHRLKTVFFLNLLLEKKHIRVILSYNHTRQRKNCNKTVKKSNCTQYNQNTVLLLRPSGR